MSCSFWNSKWAISQIAEQDNYLIEETSDGCFGRYVTTLEIIKNAKGKGKAVYTSISYNYEEKLSEVKREIVWNQQKETILREMFETGIKVENNGSCTSETTYKLRGFPYIVTFDDLDCKMDKMFYLLLK
jgi:hypothetical protein